MAKGSTLAPIETFSKNVANYATIFPENEPYPTSYSHNLNSMKFKTFTFLFAIYAALVMLASTKLDPNNPPVGRTGAPGETTCQTSGCHSGGSYTGTVEITGVPDTVVADQVYSITLTNTSNAVKSGFELTVLNSANQKTGVLTAGTGCSIGNGGGRQYVRQSSPHTLSGGSTSWTFTWKAPTTVVGDSIYFYYASLCANGTGNDHGDNALKGSKTVVLPTPISGSNEVELKYSVSVYPNPSADYLNVDFSGKAGVSILNIAGEQVFQSSVVNHGRFDISKLNAGFYLVKFDVNGESFTKSFVKK
ncbi:MAG: T9SS type A sorting domain-containing protein [Saprospiraceae bacterium]|nr:T9SS type A sorting domain-containing protein [Saprospiraceae bacterium]